MSADLLITLSMPIVKTSIVNGVPQWQSTISTDDIDSMGERLDVSLYDELVNNFHAWQRQDTGVPVVAALKAKGWGGPILEPGHFSLQVDPNNRAAVQIGTVDNLYRNGRSLKARGTFAKTEAGWAAFKRATEGDEQIQTSICFVPDPAKVEFENGTKVYKAGSGLAYMDHIAMTVIPVNTFTDFEAIAKSAAVQTMEDDVLAVLGDEVGQKVISLSKLRRGTLKSQAVAKSIGDNSMDPTQVQTPQPATVAPVTQPTPAPVAPVAAPAPITQDIGTPVPQPQPQPAPVPAVTSAPVQAPAPQPAPTVPQSLSELTSAVLAGLDSLAMPAQQMPQLANPTQFTGSSNGQLPTVTYPYQQPYQAVPLSQAAQAVTQAPAELMQQPVTITMEQFLSMREIVSRSVAVAQHYAALYNQLTQQQAQQPVARGYGYRQSIPPQFVPPSAIVQQQQPVAKSNADKTVNELTADVTEQLNQARAVAYGIQQPAPGPWLG